MLNSFLSPRDPLWKFILWFRLNNVVSPYQFFRDPDWWLTSGYQGIWWEPPTCCIHLIFSTLILRWVKKNCPHISKAPWIMEFQNAFRISSGDKHIHKILNCKATFPDGWDGKDSACSAGDLGSTPGSGRSPGEGNSYPLQCSCLENSMDIGAWQATVHGVTKSRIQLSDWCFHFQSLHKITNSKTVFKVSFLKYNVQSKVFMVESLVSSGIALAFNTWSFYLQGEK